MKDYIEQASLTSSGDHEIFTDFIDRKEYDRVMQGFAAAAAAAEKMKKQIFYGKDISSIRSIEPLIPTDREDLHANMGIMGESSELVDANTRQDVLLEGGDLLWYIAKKFRNYNITFDEAMEANIEKLKARYPDRFNHSAAINRVAEGNDPDPA